MGGKKSAKRSSQATPVPARHGPTSLVTLLGFKKVSEHIDDLGLFYLIGCAYHDGAGSLRGIAKMLAAQPAGLLAEDRAGRVSENLPKSLRAIHQAVGVLEGLLGEELVNRTGEGLSYDGLTEEGQRLWELTAEFVREFWA
jgi:hypothetical protein